MRCLFLLWFILNQAEIIPTDRLSRHLLHIEITTTFVVYKLHLQVCGAVGSVRPTDWRISVVVFRFSPSFSAEQRIGRLLQSNRKAIFLTSDCPVCTAQ